MMKFFVGVCLFLYGIGVVSAQKPIEKRITQNDFYLLTTDAVEFDVRDMLYLPSTRNVLVAGISMYYNSERQYKAPVRGTIDLSPAINNSSRLLKGTFVQHRKDYTAQGVSIGTAFNRMYKLGDVIFTNRLISAKGADNWAKAASFFGTQWNGDKQYVAGLFNLKGDHKVIVTYDQNVGTIHFNVISKGGYLEDANKQKLPSYSIPGFKNYHVQVCPDPDSKGFYYMLLLHSDGIENVDLRLVKMNFGDLSFKDNSFIVKETFLNPPVLAAKQGKETLVQSSSTSIGVGVATSLTPTKSEQMIGMESFVPDNGILELNANGNLTWYFHTNSEADRTQRGGAYLAEINTEGSLIAMKKVLSFLGEGEILSYQGQFSRYVGHNRMATSYLYSASEDEKQLYLHVTDAQGNKKQAFKFIISGNALNESAKALLGLMPSKMYKPTFLNTQVILTGPSTGFVAVNVNFSYTTSQSTNYLGGIVFIPFSI